MPGLSPGGSPGPNPARTWRPTRSGLVLLALLALTAGLMLRPLLSVGDGLSPLGDQYSEGAAVRAGDGFAAEGFARTWGLPDVAYGGRFPEHGLNGPSGVRPDDPVYHGDPPGPYWYLGLLITLGGPDRLFLYRLISIGLAWVAVAGFAALLARTLGPARAAFVLATCVAAPLFTNLAHGLYNHGPILYLLALEVAVLLHWFAGRGRASAPLLALGVLGFLQGLLSYHHGALVALTPLPIALLATPAERPFPTRRVIAAVIVAGATFALAHAIHFGQSVLYFGSVAEAVAEYRFRSGKLYGLADTPWAVAPRWKLLLFGFGRTVQAYFRWTELLAPASIALAAVWLGSLVCRDATSGLVGRWYLAFRSGAGWRQLGAVVLAAAITEIWLVLMPYHAINHLPHVGREFFLIYFCMAVSLATTVRCRLKKSADADGLN